MMFIKSAFTLSAFLVLASSMVLEPIPAQEITIHVEMDTARSGHAFPSAVVATSCEKDDEADCKEFCELSQQTSTCAAKGNKITCYCKGGKSESNCEERCLFCAPDKMAFEEASRVFNSGKVKVEEL